MLDEALRARPRRRRAETTSSRAPRRGSSSASLQQLETVGGKAEQIGFYETVLGDPAHAFRRVEAFRRVTASDLRRVARRYLVDTARTVVRVVPDGSRRRGRRRPQ